LGEIKTVNDSASGSGALGSAMSSSATENLLDRLPPHLRKDLNRHLCTCNLVYKRDIIDAIAKGACTVAEVCKQTYATMGSACCKQQVERLIECLCQAEGGE